MTNRYQDFSYDYTHNLYTRNIKYTMKRHRKSNKKHTHTVLSLDSSSNQHDTSSQNRRVWRQNSAVQAQDNTSAIYHLTQDVHNLENRPHTTGRQFQTVTTVL